MPRSSKRSDAELALLEKLGSVAEHTTNYVSITDADRRIEWVNAAFRKRTGYTLDEVRGKTPAEFMRADGNEPELLARIDAANRAGEGFKGELRIRTKAGEPYWVELDIRPVHDASGTLTGFITISTEITDRKATEQRLLEASMFGAMIEESLNEIIVLDAETLRFLDANRGARDNLGYSIDELRQMTVFDIFPGIDDPILLERRREFVRGERKMLQLEGRHRRKDGTFYDVEVHIQRVADDPSKIVSFVLDVSARKRAEAEAKAAEQRLSVAIETLPDGFVLFDADERLVLCNERYRELYSASAPVLVEGARFEDILRYGLERGQYAEAVGREEAWLAERLASHKAPSSAIVQQLDDGRWVRIVERRTPDGGRVGLRIDITEQLESRERAERAEQRLIDAIEALPAAFWLYDADDRLVMYNDRYRDFFPRDSSFLGPGLAYEDVIRNAVRQGREELTAEEQDQRVAAVLKDSHTASYEREYQLGDGRWVRSFNSRISDGGRVGFGIDITEARVRQEKLQHAAATDPLTGLANRRGLADRLAEIAANAREDERIAFMHIDLDKFKTVNDAVGHDAGDHVLQHCAQVLRKATRGEDLVARVGGDEFVVVCSRAEDEADVAGMAERLVSRLSAPVPYGDKLCHIGASIGVAFWTPASEPDVQKRLTDADIALQRSKEEGRGRFRIFQDDMRNRALMSAKLAQEIFEGLRRDEFEPYLQAQFDIASGLIVGFESLIRWNHPKRGLLTPGEFLFAAEEANLMDALDQRMLERSCALVPELRAAGFTDPKISINMSGLRLGDARIVERIMATTTSFGVEPEQLVLEILESTLLDDRAANVDDNIRRLVASGFSLELDDFGTGHAAIANLRKYPLGRIKIDRSLVNGIDTDFELMMITGAIANLARSLGLKVLAEGVETDAELGVLRQIGCTCVQGYLFSRPMSPADLFAWIGDRGRRAGARMFAANS